MVGVIIVAFIIASIAVLVIVLLEKSRKDEASKPYGSDIQALTIEEFSMLREAMYAVRTSDSPSAFQAKPFFKDEENFDKVEEKLRKYLIINHTDK